MHALFIWFQALGTWALNARAGRKCRAAYYPYNMLGGVPCERCKGHPGMHRNTRRWS